MPQTDVKFYQIDLAFKPALIAIDLVLKDLNAFIRKFDDTNGVVIVQTPKKFVRFSVKPLSSNTSLICIEFEGRVLEEGEKGGDISSLAGLPAEIGIIGLLAMSLKQLFSPDVSRGGDISDISVFVTAAARRSVILSEYSAALSETLVVP